MGDPVKVHVMSVELSWVSWVFVIVFVMPFKH